MIISATPRNEPRVFSVAGGTAVALTVPNPEKRDEPNQDAAMVVALDDGTGVLAVADGMGGLPAGAVASRLALEALSGRLKETRANDGGLRAAILDGFEEGNRAVLERSPGSGTTLVAAALDGRTARPFHVGDSVAVVTGQRGRLKLQTLAHSPVAYAVEAGVISEREALRHDERHVVSNALGSDEMRIELGAALRLAARDTLVLASDGLFDNLTIGEIVDKIRCGPLAGAVSRLAALALARMERGEGTPSKPDDLTIVAFRPSG